MCTVSGKVDIVYPLLEEVGAMRETPGPALRRDAEENRQRLLSAARELFAERGLGVTLNDIAHHARVGVGTAYRRFANKSEIIDALVDRQIDEIADLADEALADPDPWHGLVRFLERSMSLQARDRGLAHVLSGQWITPDQHDCSRDRLAGRINAIVDRAKEAGVLRADLEGTDLIFIQLALNAVLDRTRDVSYDLHRRYLWIILDGLRAHPDVPSSLPVAPLTVDQTHSVMGPTSPAPDPNPQAQ
jgi:AcrR family transcriptional regulator